MPRRASITLVLLGLGRQAYAEPAGARPAEPVEVEVRGTPSSPAVARKDESVASSTLERDWLEPPGLSAPDVLRTAVGVTVTETGGLGAASTASVRGATASQTPVYLAGVRLNDDVGGAADLAMVPLFLIDRIEVYRGNAPLEADRFGIGGAIFFEPIRPRAPRVRIGGMAGSFGSRAAWAAAGTQSRGTSLLIGARFEGADNDYPFYDDRGTLETTADDRREHLQNADAALVNLWLVGRQTVSEGRIDVVLNRFEREKGAPGLANVATTEARTSASRTLAAVSGFAPFAGEASLEARTTFLEASSTLTDPLYRPSMNPGELGLGTDRVESRGDRLDEELALTVPLGAASSLRARAEASHERLRRSEGEAAEPVLAERRVSARLSAAAALGVAPHLSVRPLAALECHATGAHADATCDVLEPTARLGALATLGELSLFGGVGRYVRVPTLGELFGTSAVVRGQPSLRSEAGVTIDLGARYATRLPGETRPLYAALSGYLRNARDLITFVRTAQSTIVPINLGRASVRGLELEAGTGFLRHFQGDLALTLFDGRDETPGRTLLNARLPYQPRLVVAPGVRAETPSLGTFPVERASLGGRLVHESSRYADPAGQSVIPAQTTVDVDVGVEGLGRSAILRARVGDLFDARRYDVVGFPLPGRTFFVSLELGNGQ